MILKKAVVIGIDDYGHQHLNGCVNDAREVARLLSSNGKGVNLETFGVDLITSDKQKVTSNVMMEAVDRLFSSPEIETAVFYFAGHGVLSNNGNAGHLVSQDGIRAAPGLSLQDLMSRANQAYPNIKSTVIILDSCHAGFIGQAGELNNENIAHIGSGVTILAATHRDGRAAEDGSRGFFTSILVDGLEGSASDILGNVTPASLYALIDQTLGPLDQRPIYKANVMRFITLRHVAPKVAPETLRKLPKYFPTPDAVYPLTPSHERDRKNIPEEYRHLPLDHEKMAIFEELQACNRQGLVTPVEAKHMYDAAIGWKSCCLTPAGKHYRKLAEKGHIFGPAEAS